MRLNQRVAIITGAANGMGACEARLFAQEGARVLLVDRDEMRGADVARELSEKGARACFVHADVTEEQAWNDVMAEARKRLGEPDILINNAGISASSVDPEDIDGWDRLMRVNARSVYLGTKVVGDAMKEQRRGSIVNISSIMGIVGGPTGHPAYHASKAAVRNLTKAMGARLAPYGVRVNSVHPGYMELMSSSNPEHVRANRTSLIPMGRTGTVSEAAYGVLFLASDEASYITGAELAIDGGFLSI